MGIDLYEAWAGCKSRPVSEHRGGERRATIIGEKPDKPTQRVRFPHASIPMRQPVKLPPRVAAILKDAAERHDLTVEEMLRGPKTTRAVAAKSKAARELRRLGFSYPAIGRHLGMHHTSVMSYMKMRYNIARPVVIPCPDLSGEWAI